ncbi:MAG: serine/threonine-protein kinase [Akkermansiaceae bacterium]|nr:serine/threonine-protein kinase [Akkermansiaceae bacterium]
METRYEIREKIGQGGLGAVFRAYDTRMNREVAIKRIPVTADDPALQAESTHQLVKEAGALASLQHPNIVTIYDVESDADGPFVVMELISGKTLEELIQEAPLTWPDFRELALHTLEGLIAAHELKMIHSDIKPSNLMLSWLPSGKFQTKIVDFGLATLTHAQSHEALKCSDSVFGSIFFMAPEQFERALLDDRADLYAMGCVYYQALTCIEPFQGTTVEAVMNAHLEHRVIPLQDLRADIPVWASEWIMWIINRMRNDRPASARDALQVFLQNDQNHPPTRSLGKARARSATGPRPRLATHAAPPGAKLEPSPEEIAQDPPPPLVKITAPQPLLPPEGSKPSLYGATLVPPISIATSAIHHPVGAHATPIKFQKDSRISLRITFAAAGIVMLALAGSLLAKRIDQHRQSLRHGLLLDQARSSTTKEIILSGPELNRFLNEAANADTEEMQQTIFHLLTIAKPADATNFDSCLTEFASTSTQLLPETRKALILSVIGKRSNCAMVPSLLDFARKTRDINSAIAALQVLSPFSGDEQLPDLLAVVQFHPNPTLKKAAEEALVETLKRSKQRDAFAKQLAQAIDGTTDLKIRKTLIKLQSASTGG